MLKVKWTIEDYDINFNEERYREPFAKLRSKLHKKFVKHSCGSYCIRHEPYKWYHRVFFLWWYNLWGKLKIVKIPNKELMSTELADNIRKSIDKMILDDIIKTLDEEEATKPL